MPMRSLKVIGPDVFRSVVRKGIDQMPAFPHLTEAQVQALARYVEQATR